MRTTIPKLRRMIRKVIQEHVGDEHHNHPHDHHNVIVPRVNNKDEAEDLLHDTFLAVEEYLSLEEIEAIIAMLY